MTGPTGPTEPTALPSPQRPLDHSPVHTDDLPATPIRDRAIPATAWAEAPDDLLRLGDDLPGAPVARYVRRIGPWILWRAGPPTKGDARYWALHADGGAPTRTHTFTLAPAGTGSGAGPSGTVHQRFRTWKEDLRDHP